MTVKLVQSDTKSLLPVLCKCQDCGRKYEVTEISDFVIKMLVEFDIPSPPPTKHLVVICQIEVCGGYAFPPKNSEKALLDAYEEWFHLQKKNI